MNIVVSLLFPLIAVVLGWVAWQRSGRRARIAWVEALRVVLVLLAVVLLWQPETVFLVPPDSKPKVVLLIDESESMLTADAGGPANPMDRQSLAAEISSAAAWDRLDGRYEKITLPICEPEAGGSDLGGALSDAIQQYPGAASFILVSDGDFNGGRSPVEVAADWAAARGSSVALFSVPLGAEQRMPDLELSSCEVPTYGVIDKPIRIPFTVRNWFDDLREINVSLLIDGRVEQQQSMRVAGNRGEDSLFIWKTNRPGLANVSVAIEPTEGEFNLENNRIDKAVDVRPENLRVLIIEGTPRWEYRFLRNALLRDPGVEVSTLLFQPDLPEVGGGKGYLPSLPEDPAEFASYDVIFVGDVGVAPGQLTEAQCQQLVGLVRQQAVGLVLMPGPRGAQASLLTSPLGELFPVVIDPRVPRGVGGASPAQASLTVAGRTSLLTQLEDRSEANWQVWKTLPGFYWHAAVTRAKAGSEVLAVHAEKSNAFGRIPLLVTRPSGAGKVLFMGTDAAWRWRRGVEDKYHYRFWGQVIRWMAYQRNMAVGDRMRLSFLPESPRAGETVTIRAAVMDDQGAPSQASSVSLNVRDENGKSAEGQGTVQRLDRVSGEWGMFEGRWTPEEAGEWILSTSHPDSNEELEARMVVRGRDREQIGRPARPDVLRETARVAHGAAFRSSQLKPMIDKINAIPEDPRQTRRIQWWNHPAVLAALFAGLTLFWIGRKWAGLV